MNRQRDFPGVFARLEELLRKHAEGLVCVEDTSNKYYLDTPHVMKNKKPLFFGSVQIRKNYVSFHLMPVYVFPELLDGMSPGLRRRMQGKSCFNFTAVDDGMFAELDRLVHNAYARYADAGYVGHIARGEGDGG